MNNYDQKQKINEINMYNVIRHHARCISHGQLNENRKLVSLQTKIFDFVQNDEMEIEKNKYGKTTNKKIRR